MVVELLLVTCQAPPICEFQMRPDCILAHATFIFKQLCCIACSQSACNWRQTDVDPEDLKRWRERAQSANKLQFLMMSGKHVARGVTKPTGRKKGKCATMRTWTLGSSLMPMITCPPKYQVLPTNIFSALDPHVVPWIVITFVDGCLTLDMECVEPDRDCLMDLKVESR